MNNFFDVLGNKRGTHFSTKDLESMGYHFCDSLLDYCDPDRSKYFKCLKELEEMEKHINLERGFDDSDTSLVEISMDVESSSRGSDSSESNDTPTYLLKLTSQVYGKEHLLQRHEESNSDVKDPRPTVPNVYVAHCFRRPLPNQGLESHHELKSKVKRCASFQSKRSGTNWTDDEKRIYRDKRIAQTQEILQYLLPIVESSKSMKSTQMKDLFTSGADFQQHQLIPTACINIRRYSLPWTPSRKLALKTGRNLVTDTPEWLQPVPQRSLECLSPLCRLQKRKKHSELWARHSEYMMNIYGRKRETIPSRPKTDANAVSGNSLQPAESTLKSSEQTVPHPTKSNKKPNESNSPLPLRLKFHSNS
ncbi:Cytosolic carboxypeptidase 3 [Microtus ochrogaster]|uniref:Cytosolic carboxypeptidase 3 n=1 Tax=Microtus ochrogaster TaxID=79684 RepID=A0A8J6KUZ5_MICOH|nr:Cytosolic carboxypeptidase 3 [Microtus ochrogaster]